VDLQLTKRQQEIFDFIKRYGAKYGYPPTVREIGKAVGLASSSTVHAHLANLERVGLLKRNPTKPRALELLIDKAKQAVAPSGLPLVGQVAAGQPVLAEENIEEYVQVPTIAGGDYVVGRPQQTAKNGDIVVALLGDEATVKRYFKERDHVRLQPENETMKPIRTKDARVLGRVVGVFRKIK
jgi:repressor LexA